MSQVKHTLIGYTAGLKQVTSRFAAELAGRRARKGTMEGLVHEMEDNGWLQ